MWRWAALCALLLSLSGTRAQVPAPLNVTVRCGDQRPVVSWDYSPEQPTLYTVQLFGSGRSFSRQTEDHELDLSDLVWDQIFNFFYVNVTAETGTNRSKPSRSPSFSYQKYRTVDVHCHLQFPPVTLSRDGNEALLTFENPLHFYEGLRTISGNVLHLSIESRSLLQGRSHYDKECGPERVCEVSMTLPADSEPCVNLSGLVVHSTTEGIEVLRAAPVCSSAASETLWLAAVLSIVFLLLVILLLMFCICKTRAWDFQKTPTPQTLVLHHQDLSPDVHQSQTAYSQIQVLAQTPRTDLDPESLSLESDNVQGEDQALILKPDTDDSADTASTSLHSSDLEMEESHYERRDPQLMEVDMGGDKVTGYTS